MNKLLFVDTNIWLDFYRARTDAGLALLEHLEKANDNLVITYQLEMEFKKNRQAAIWEGMQELKAPENIQRPALFSNAQDARLLKENIIQAAKRVKKLKNKMKAVIENPAVNDPVYKTTQRIFHSGKALVLDRENSFRHVIRRRAFRRYIHGCPPRKKNDTSIGDAFNWEWMLECCIKNNSELVIVSRDGDYGLTVDNTSYINDHLRQEFSERVSRRRKLLLYTKLTEALRHFKITVTQKEAEEEEQIIKSLPRPEMQQPLIHKGSDNIMEIFKRFNVEINPSKLV